MVKNLKDIRNVQVITAMVTPMKRSGAVNYLATANLAEYLVDEKGSEGLVITGTTGESPTLKPREMYKLYNAVAAAVGDRCCIIAGTGSNDTSAAVEMTRSAVGTEVVDAILSVVPYYNKPSQAGLIEHFLPIADCECPVILYNIPDRSIINLEPETIIELSRHKFIQGVKECNVDQIPEYRFRVSWPDNFRVFTGNDGRLIDTLNHAGHGVISVASHFIGREMERAISMHSSDPAGARALMEKFSKFIKTLFMTSNPTMTKAGLNMLGLNVGGLRRPLIEANAEETAILRKEMESIGLL
jgi:4-hydroxy-tetrahydrodipicolinate synthase